MGCAEGRVAFISGGARGQGRSHAIRLAQEGASIVVFDICEQLGTVAYPGATEADLRDTVSEVEAVGGRIVARKADVRNLDAVKAVFDEGMEEFGRIDIVLANAGIWPVLGQAAHTMQAWRDALDVMLTGVLNTCEVAIPTLIEQGDGGAIVITSSIAGLKGPTRGLDLKSLGFQGYIAAKHGVVGLMRSYANALGPYGIRCNTIHPNGVNTPMVVNEQFAQLAADKPALADAMRNPLPVSLVEPEDVSNAVLYLCTDSGRYVTGMTMTVDAGAAVY